MPLSFEDQARALGAALRRRRKRLGLTQLEAAAAAGIHEVQLSRIETGSTNVTLATLVALANVYGVSVRALFPT